jgi:deoxyribonucleoside regulator
MCICTITLTRHQQFCKEEISKGEAMNEVKQQLLARVSSMFYEQDMTQSEIGEKLGLSRVKIYRLLKEAKKEGVVQIIVNWPVKRDEKLEQHLKKTFKLKEALVLIAPKQEDALLPELGQLAARYLETLLKDHMTLAICLGKTTYEVIQAIRPNKSLHVNVVQAIGSLPRMQQYDSAALVRQFAEKVGGEAFYLSSPPIADTKAAAEVMRKQADIKRTLDIARKADVALVGVGSLEPSNSVFVKSEAMSEKDLRTLVANDAVGDTSWQIFTEDGKLHKDAFNQRVIGLSLADLKKIPTTLAVAGSVKKAKAILGSLNTGVVNVLCTDDKAAKEIFRLHEKVTA